MIMEKTEKRKCVKCGKEIAISEGVILLRGASFACKDCHQKEQHKNKDKEVCEFC
jgi:predicted RNA-binding Zn-ribbon protein involved in translation (DUF1610 family)